MMTPAQEFHKARQNLDKIYNDHATTMRQEHNKFKAEMDKKLEDVNTRIANEVQLQVQVHLQLMQQALERMEAKLHEHFG